MSHLIVKRLTVTCYITSYIQKPYIGGNFDLTII